MKKIFIIVISLIPMLLVCFFVANVIQDLQRDGYAYYGDVWQPTLEKALEKEADDTSETMQILTPKIVFDTTYFEDVTLMTFLSKGETLVSVAFVSNEDGEYCVYGWTEEWNWDSPSEFLLNGDEEQLILIPYEQHDNVLLGWCYSNVQFTVNGIVPTRKTFEFEAQGKERSIDYWMISEFDPNEEVSIEYLNN